MTGSSIRSPSRISGTNWSQLYFDLRTTQWPNSAFIFMNFTFIFCAFILHDAVCMSDFLLHQWYLFLPFSPTRTFIHLYMDFGHSESIQLSYKNTAFESPSNHCWKGSRNYIFSAQNFFFLTKECFKSQILFICTAECRTTELRLNKETYTYTTHDMILIER